MMEKKKLCANLVIKMQCAHATGYILIILEGALQEHFGGF